jgi:hypothetical protein
VKLMLLDSGAVAEAMGFEEKLQRTEDKHALLSKVEKRMASTPPAGWTPAEAKALRKALIKEFLAVSRVWV